MKKNNDNPFVIQESGKQIARRKVSGYRQRQREGEDFLIEYEGHSFKLPFSSRYLQLLFVIVLTITLIITVKVINLQLFSADRYRALAEGNRIKVERIIAPRGIFFDRNLTPLVKNTPNFSVNIIPGNLPRSQEERNLVLERLYSILNNDSFHAKNGRSQEELNDALDTLPLNPVISVSDSIEYSTMLALALEADLPGVLVEQNVIREYIHHTSYSHILGYTSSIPSQEWEAYKDNGYYFTDKVGRVGLEHVYELRLHGTDEELQREVNVFGEEQKPVSREMLEAGDNIVLTIDSDTQRMVSEVVTRMAQASGGKAAAVLLDPTNGEIISLVSVPNYDNNAFALRDSEEITRLLSDERMPLFNRTVSGEYPPGSTFKPLVAAAALEEGVITPQTSFYSSGGLQLNAWYFPDWKTGGHGRTNLYKAIGESVNTYFYYIGGGFEDFDGIGVATIRGYAQAFGLGEPLGTELSSESDGFLPTKQWKRDAKGESWYVGDTYHLSIGQGDVLLTPIQVAALTSVFANEGRLMRPHVVKSITNSAGEPELITEPEIWLDVPIAPEHIQAVKRSLRETVLTGSATSLQNLPVTAAGKTGTAQVGGSQAPHSWFTVFAPYDNPQIVLTVLIENGGGDYNRALVAAREILQSYF